MSAPEIRFPEFKAPWRPTVAGAAFKHSRARGEAGLPIYSVTLDRGMVRRDSLDRHIESDAADGQNLRAQPGDIVYNMMRMWQGAVGVAPEECMVSPAYVVLRPTKETNPQFFNYWFQTSRMLHKLGAYSHGLTKDRLRLYPDDFSKIPLHLPTRAEQDRIAAFFGEIDAKLAALREKADGLRQFKTGLMQRLFSQELRFTRENGSDFPDWEERKLRSFGELYGGLSGKSAEDFGEGVPFITYRQVFESAQIDVSKFALVKIGTKEKQNRVVFGDVLMTTSSETPNEVGFASVMLDEVEDLYLNSFCFGYRPHDLKALLPEFSKYLFRSPLYRREVIKLAQGSTRFNISRTGFLKIKLLFPHPDEQQKIASTLSALDAKIDAMTAQIAHMETFKKGLLQKMFV